MSHSLFKIELKKPWVPPGDAHGLFAVLSVMVGPYPKKSCATTSWYVKLNLYMYFQNT